MTTITPFLWFDDNAEQAIERYLKVFDEAELVEENRLPDGQLFLATIRLQGTTLTLMNGGPHHKLTEAFSLSVSVETQQEVDEISDALIDGGGEQGPCGWLVDAFGLSWQIVPTLLMRLLRCCQDCSGTWRASRAARRACRTTGSSPRRSSRAAPRGTGPGAARAGCPRPRG